MLDCKHQWTLLHAGLHSIVPALSRRRNEWLLGARLANDCQTASGQDNGGYIPSKMVLLFDKITLISDMCQVFLPEFGQILAVLVVHSSK